MSFASLLSNFRRLREQWGIPAAIFAVFVAGLRSRLHITICGIYFRAHSRSDSRTPTDSAITYCIFSKSNLDELLKQASRSDLQMSEEFIREAIGKGDICIAALIDENIVSYGWSAFSATHVEDCVYVVFPSGYRYGYKAYTRPEYRGRHLRDGAIALRDRYCAERGCAHSVSFIEVNNYESIQANLRSKITRVGFVVFYKNGPSFFSYRSPGVKKIGVRFESREDALVP